MLDSRGMIGYASQRGSGASTSLLLVSTDGHACSRRLERIFQSRSGRVLILQWPALASSRARHLQSYLVKKLLLLF
jgi:hypothetical protein